VDAWMHLPNVGLRYKFNELPTCCILDANAQILGNAATIMNKDKLTSLSPEDQQIIRDVVKKHGKMYVVNCIKQDEIAIKKMADQGIETYKMPEAEMQKMKRAAVVIWEKYIADTESKGLSGKTVATEYVNALKALGENPVYQP
jgi:TRAP-type C4-dicarboxylate transport system substrate-binding protein